MKRLVILATMLALTAAAVPAEAGFGIKVKGGYSWISYGDFNDFADDVTSDASAESPTLDNINWVPEISAEFAFPLFPTFSGAIGIGYLSGKSDYSFNYQGVSYSYVHEVKSVPIVANVYWEPSLVFINPFVYGGVGFYKTDLEFRSSLIYGTETAGSDSELNKWGFGLHAGGGVRIALIPTISFDVGVQGRWAEIKGFEGTTTNLNGETIEVMLGANEVEGIRVYGPAMKGFGVEEASVNLSGFTIYVGMTFGF